VQLLLSGLLQLSLQQLFPMQEYFQLLNKYYDKIYVLSVHSAEARRKLFKERFKELNYSFFYGADKKNFIIPDLIEKNIYSEDLAKKHHRYTKTMMPGEIGCSLSHRMIYEDMLKNNYSRILILEDDALPNPKVLEKVSVILAEIPSNCELLMWGWGKNEGNGFTTSLKKYGYHIQHALGFLKWDHTIINNIFAKPFSTHLKKAGFHDYCHAYGITKTAAEKFIQMQTPIQYIADNLLAHAITRNIVKGYIVYPAAILHDNLPDGTARDSYIR
jgi:glycosyl transferase family 25